MSKIGLLFLIIVVVIIEVETSPSLGAVLQREIPLLQIPDMIIYFPYRHPYHSKIQGQINELEILLSLLFLRHQAPCKLLQSLGDWNGTESLIKQERFPHRFIIQNGHFMVLFTHPLTQFSVMSVYIEILIFNHFTISKDTLLIILQGSSPTFGNSHPNFHPCRALHINQSGLFIYNMLVNDWGPSSYSRENYSIRFRSFGGVSIPIRVPNAKPGLFKCPAINRNPWTSNLFELLVCDYLPQCFNLSIMNPLPRYGFPSIQFGSIIKPFTRSSLYEYNWNLETGFLVPLYSLTLDWEGIFGPIGVEVLIYTATSIVGITLFLYSAVKIGTSIGIGGRSKKVETLSLWKSFELIWRPVLDQCFEKLPNQKDYFRLALIPWLFYCLILTETYRGELVGYLIRNPAAESPTNFKELYESGMNVFSRSNVRKMNNNSTTLTLNSSTPLNWTNIKACYHTNAFISIYKELLYLPSEPLIGIYRKLARCDSTVFSHMNVYKRLLLPNEVYVDEIPVLEAIQDMAENSKVQVRISRERIIHPVYLALGDDMFQPEVLQLLNRLKDSGLFEEVRKTGVERQKGIILKLKRSLVKKGEYNRGEDEGVGLGNVILQITHIKTLLVLLQMLYLISKCLFIAELITKLPSPRNYIRRYNSNL